MKKIVSVALCGMMAAGLVAVPAMAEDLPILGAGIYSSTDNFNSYIGKAIVKASEGKFKVNIDDGQLDQSTQLNQIDTAIAKGAKAIAVSVVDTTAAPAIIQKVQDAGNIPVIFFNKEITDKNVVNSYDNLYQVTSTGGDYGATIEGEMIAKYWKAHPEADKNGDGKIQFIDLMGDPGHTASRERTMSKKQLKMRGSNSMFSKRTPACGILRRPKKRWMHGFPSTEMKLSSLIVRMTRWLSEHFSQSKPLDLMKREQKVKNTFRLLELMHSLKRSKRSEAEK